MKHGFYDENDEISKNAIAFTADEPKYGGNSGNFPNCNQIICVAVPNEGNRRNFDNGQSICQYFSILFVIFGNFPNVLTCSSQY